MTKNFKYFFLLFNKFAINYCGAIRILKIKKFRLTDTQIYGKLGSGDAICFQEMP